MFQNHSRIVMKLVLQAYKEGYDESVCVCFHAINSQMYPNVILSTVPRNCSLQSVHS
jgi:hypothetical protein